MTGRYSIAVLAALIAVLLTGAASAQLQKGRRVALVIGNAAYAQAVRLANPVNDAADVSRALQRLGFEVNSATDLSGDAFHDAVSAFSRDAAGADLALFFYAGHAVQFEEPAAPQRVDTSVAGRCQVWQDCLRNIPHQRSPASASIAKLQRCGVAPAGC